MPHLATLMAGADIAIGAGGGTIWERMCIGLPSIVVSIAQNQVPACEELASCGLIRYLGQAGEVDAATLAAGISGALSDPDSLCAMGEKARLLVDGLGAVRVAETLAPTGERELRLRRARRDDALTYFAWVSDPAVRQSAIDRRPIELEAHLRWFYGRLANPDCHLFVLEASGLAVGQVRFELEGDHASIDYSLDALVRGRGWAKALLRSAIQRLNDTHPVLLKAAVRRENAASLAAFLRLGFSEQKHSEPGGDDMRVFILHSSQLAKGERTNA